MPAKPGARGCGRRFHCGYIEKLTKPWEFPDLTGTNHEFRIVDLTQGMETVSDRDIRNLHILVLDDDADDREGMKRCLRQLGVTRVREADDPVSALEFMQSRRVDVLITERYLPFVRFLRTSRKSPASSVPIVMVSDRGRKADIHEAQDAGIDEFVAKPVVAETLLERLLEAVRRSRPFVESEAYMGPDRRRESAKIGDRADGQEVDAATALTEEEIAALLKR